MEKDKGIIITNLDKQKQCDIHVVSKSFKNKKRTLTYMGIDKWGKEVWEYLD